MAFELNSFASDTSLAEKAAADWLKELQVHAAKPGAATYTVALSGGRITKTFFGEILRQAKALPTGGGELFKRVHFFWADERCVPPTDPESNYAIAKQLLFGPLQIGDAQIHRLKGEGPEPIALQEAVRDISTVAPVTKGQPVLDMLFLGTGEDGHVASLFPAESEEVMKDPAVYRAVTAVKPPPRRLTLGYDAIVAAKQVWVLVSGAGKEASLAESLSLSGKTPLGRVLKRRTQTRVLSDVTPKANQ